MMCSVAVHDPVAPQNAVAHVGYVNRPCCIACRLQPLCCLGADGPRFRTNCQPECAVYVADPLPSVPLGDLAGDSARPPSLGCEFDAFHGSDPIEQRGHGSIRVFGGDGRRATKADGRHVDAHPEGTGLLLSECSLGWLGHWGGACTGVGLHTPRNHAAARRIPGGPN
jgi:hypothetical protein